MPANAPVEFIEAEKKLVRLSQILVEPDQREVITLLTGHLCDPELLNANWPQPYKQLINLYFTVFETVKEIWKPQDNRVPFNLREAGPFPGKECMQSAVKQMQAMITDTKWEKALLQRQGIEPAKQILIFLNINNQDLWGEYATWFPWIADLSCRDTRSWSEGCEPQKCTFISVQHAYYYLMTKILPERQEDFKDSEVTANSNNPLSVIEFYVLKQVRMMDVRSLVFSKDLLPCLRIQVQLRLASLMQKYFDSYGNEAMKFVGALAKSNYFPTPLKITKRIEFQIPSFHWQVAFFLRRLKNACLVFDDPQFSINNELYELYKTLCFSQVSRMTRNQDGLYLFAHDTFQLRNHLQLTKGNHQQNPFMLLRPLSIFLDKAKAENLSIQRILAVDDLETAIEDVRDLIRNQHWSVLSTELKQDFFLCLNQFFSTLKMEKDLGLSALIQFMSAFPKPPTKEDALHLEKYHQTLMSAITLPGHLLDKVDSQFLETHFKDLKQTLKTKFEAELPWLKAELWMLVYLERCGQGGTIQAADFMAPVLQIAHIFMEEQSILEELMLDLALLGKQAQMPDPMVTINHETLFKNDMQLVSRIELVLISHLNKLEKSANKGKLYINIWPIFGAFRYYNAINKKYSKEEVHQQEQIALWYMKIIELSNIQISLSLFVDPEEVLEEQEDKKSASPILDFPTENIAARVKELSTTNFLDPSLTRLANLAANTPAAYQYLLREGAAPKSAVPWRMLEYLVLTGVMHEHFWGPSPELLPILESMIQARKFRGLEVSHLEYTQHILSFATNDTSWLATPSQNLWIEAHRFLKAFCEKPQEALFTQLKILAKKSPPPTTEWEPSHKYRQLTLIHLFINIKFDNLDEQLELIKDFVKSGYFIDCAGDKSKANLITYLQSWENEFKHMSKNAYLLQAAKPTYDGRFPLAEQAIIDIQRISLFLFNAIHDGDREKTLLRKERLFIAQNAKRYINGELEQLNGNLQELYRIVNGILFYVLEHKDLASVFGILSLDWFINKLFTLDLFPEAEHVLDAMIGMRFENPNDKVQYEHLRFVMDYIADARAAEDKDIPALLENIKKLKTTLIKLDQKFLDGRFDRINQKALIEALYKVVKNKRLAEDLGSLWKQFELAPKVIEEREEKVAAKKKKKKKKKHNSPSDGPQDVEFAADSFLPSLELKEFLSSPEVESMMSHVIETLSAADINIPALMEDITTLTLNKSDPGSDQKTLGETLHKVLNNRELVENLVGVRSQFEFGPEVIEEREEKVAHNSPSDVPRLDRGIQDDLAEDKLPEFIESPLDPADEPRDVEDGGRDVEDEEHASDIPKVKDLPESPVVEPLPPPALKPSSKLNPLANSFFSPPQKEEKKLDPQVSRAKQGLLLQAIPKGRVPEEIQDLAQTLTNLNISFILHGDCIQGCYDAMVPKKYQAYLCTRESLDQVTPRVKALFDAIELEYPVECSMINIPEGKDIFDLQLEWSQNAVISIEAVSMNLSVSPTGSPQSTFIIKGTAEAISALKEREITVINTARPFEKDFLACIRLIAYEIRYMSKRPFRKSPSPILRYLTDPNLANYYIRYIQTPENREQFLKALDDSLFECPDNVLLDLGFHIRVLMEMSLFEIMIRLKRRPVLESLPAVQPYLMVQDAYTGRKTSGLFLAAHFCIQNFAALVQNRNIIYNWSWLQFMRLTPEDQYLVEVVVDSVLFRALPQDEFLSGLLAGVFSAYPHVPVPAPAPVNYFAPH